ncbi:MAG TPA: polysaccharide deacetylase family protein [Acidimicrobiales bacterium]|nr:polysaccharide deacetylase family protein [Acidimicrobiales bacterium]
MTEGHVMTGDVDRRRFLAFLGAAVATAMTACRGDVLPGAAAAAGAHAKAARRPPADPVVPEGQPRPAVPVARASTHGAIAPAVPGRPVVVQEGPRGTRLVALTIDDGTSAECVDRYASFAERSGIPITFSPNGVNPGWDMVADRLRPLVDNGQVQIINHTWSHPDLLRVGDDRIRAEIERNEEWIERTFGVSARPWFRPPYGAHSRRTDEMAAELGYTRIVLWNGSFGDSELLRPDEVLALADRYLQPGTIMLGHANYLTITGLFDQVQLLMLQRGLRPVTLDEMFYPAPAN